MSRILTGIQSTGIPHIGNLLGAILPALEMSSTQNEPSFFFIANFHTLTSVKDPNLIKQYTIQVAAVWLACGLDPEKEVFYRQSHVPEVTELAWFLSCFAPFPMLANAHSFKDKSENLSSVNVGLFTYPVLMAADILLYDAELVPVGKDQKQHLEITKDIALAINRNAADTFVIPEAIIREDVMTVPGTDGRKMSKSYGNFINVFQSEKELKKQVMGIVTDSKGIEEKKDPDQCNVAKIFSLIAEKDDVSQLREDYQNGGLGYGHAKTRLLESILQKFSGVRDKYFHLMENPKVLEEMLLLGEKKARKVAQITLERVRSGLGYSR